MTLRQDFYQPRVSRPPKVGDVALGRWLSEVADALNAIPAFSVFSYVTPESNVTAQRGTWGVNLASGTTVFWVKASGAGNTGWSSVATDRAY